MTVLLTTHYMDEAQFLADRVAVIVGGRIVAEGPPATLGWRDVAKARIRYRPPADARIPSGFVRRRRVGWLYGDRARRRCESVARAHGVGHGARGAAGWAAGDTVVARGRLPLAHRCSIQRRQPARLDRGAGSGRLMHSGAHSVAAPVRQQGLLAQSRRGVLRGRVPTHVPGHLHVD